jgi:hypothetical protein
VISTDVKEVPTSSGLARSGRITRHSYKALIQLFRLAGLPTQALNDKGRYRQHPDSQFRRECSEASVFSTAVLDCSIVPVQGW